MNPLHHNIWRHGGVVYQIYPRSFYDANGDGIGDLQGITQKLDYLNDGTPDSLGVSAIWLSPFFPSPMADFGYDVSDYCDVDPMFGTLDDFRELVAQAHARNIRVMLDFVPNHTSEQHAWFKESRSSRNNPKRDWYTWRDPKADGSPPNNWLAVFGGSAWELDKVTGQYYLHSFLKEQPDLNWSNPEVRNAMKAAIGFWLDLGVDGLRLDAVSWMAKDDQFRDNPLNPNFQPGRDDPYQQLIVRYSRERPELFEYLNEINDFVAKYPNRFIVTEAYPDNRNDIPAYLKFYDNCRGDLSAPFNFEAIMMPWEAASFKRFMDEFQAALRPDQIPIYVLGNHDRPRLATRIGREAARTAAVMLLTLPGLPFIYSGEELGMENVPIPPELVQDPFEKNVPGMGLGRDPSRTPMQWSVGQYAGFSTVAPWLPVADNFQTNNVESESQDGRSFLSLYRTLIRLRNSSDVLKYGSYVPLDLKNESLFGFKRIYGGKTYTVILNFSGEQQDTTALSGTAMMVACSHPPQTMGEFELINLRLRPNEAMVMETVRVNSPAYTVANN